MLDLFPERAAGMTADCLKRHPDVEIISRDRCGLFAQGAHEGAPQARQIADRFHILQNLREAVQAQLGRAAGFSARPLLPADGEVVASVRDKHGGTEHRHLTRIANQRSRQAAFDHVRVLRNEGRKVSDIVRRTGFDRRTVAKWIRAEALPERSAAAPKTTSPRHFEDYLSRRWSEGCVRGRRLFQEIKARGYTGSFSNLERLLAKWRNPKCRTVKATTAVPNPRPVDPAVRSHLGLRISDSESKKPLNVRISTKHILTFDGSARGLTFKRHRLVRALESSSSPSEFIKRYE